MDDIIVSPTVHLVVGTVVLVAGLAAVVVAVRAAMKRQPVSRGAHLVFILFQLSVMLQVLIGIKLLDQGLGPLQLFVHYLGGLAPMGFYLLYYWLKPADGVTQGRWSAVVAVASFLFVLMTFTIGSMYVA